MPGSVMQVGEDMYRLFRQGDPRCKFQIGDRVRKAVQEAQGDFTEVGTEGTVAGCIHSDEPIHGPLGLSQDMYLVNWDHGVETAVADLKLEKA